MLDTHQEIRNFVLPLYSKNDAAHLIDHADKVNANAHKMNTLFGLGLNPTMITAAAYFHDICCGVDRDNHHTLAQEVIRNLSALNELPDVLNHAEWLVVGWACSEHRASFDGIYSSTLSELIASADRGIPSTVENLMVRSVIYGNTKLGYNFRDSVHHAVVHVKEKYGYDGYSRVPTMYAEYYKDILSQLKKDIATLTHQDALKYFMENPQLVGMEWVRMWDNGPQEVIRLTTPLPTVAQIFNGYKD